MSDPRPRNEREERLAAERPDSFMRRREFLAAAGALAGGAGLAAVLPPDRLLSLAASRQTRRSLSKPAQHAARQRRRADDGEPLLRPLLRVVPERRRRQRALLSRRAGPAAPDPLPAAGLPGMRVRGPGPQLGGRPRAVRPRQARRLPHRQRRVRDRLLRARRRRLPRARCPRLHHLRPLLRLDPLLDLSQPPLHDLRAVRRPEDERDPRRQPREPVGDDLRPGCGARRLRRLLRGRPAGPRSSTEPGR